MAGQGDLRCKSPTTTCTGIPAEGLVMRGGSIVAALAFSAFNMAFAHDVQISIPRTCHLR